MRKEIGQPATHHRDLEAATGEVFQRIDRVIDERQRAARQQSFSLTDAVEDIFNPMGERRGEFEANGPGGSLQVVNQPSDRTKRLHVIGLNFESSELRPDIAQVFIGLVGIDRRVLGIDAQHGSQQIGIFERGVGLRDHVDGGDGSVGRCRRFRSLCFLRSLFGGSFASSFAFRGSSDDRLDDSGSRGSYGRRSRSLEWQQLVQNLCVLRFRQAEDATRGGDDIGQQRRRIELGLVHSIKAHRDSGEGANEETGDHVVEGKLSFTQRLQHLFLHVGDVAERRQAEHRRRAFDRVRPAIGEFNRVGISGLRGADHRCDVGQVAACFRQESIEHLGRDCASHETVPRSKAAMYWS